MSRCSRTYIPNAVFHVIARGNHRIKVFKTHADLEHYSKLLWKYKTKFNVKIYAYCLMSNHVHLLVHPPEKIALSKMMHGINMSYAMRFNAKYEKVGHLWQDRYKSFAVQADQYLINLITYIEMNPLRAEICSRAEEYPWSSYRSRILGENNKILDEYIL